MDEFIYPNESTYTSQILEFRENGNPWQTVPIVEDLKKNNLKSYLKSVNNH